VIRLAFAVEVFRRERGRYPDRLEELASQYVPAVPPDPLTGQSFLHRKTEDGFLLYSVGRNLKDDGGLSLDDRPEDDTESDDVTVHFRSRQPAR
jgi:hypothetical protein